jgi:quercetin dioxygenase-like cupin family protein
VGAGEGKTIPPGILIKASPGSTDAAFEVIEFRFEKIRGAPLHIHRGRDEGFYILDGAFYFRCGEAEFEARPGAFVLIPRNTAHGFSTDSPEARALLMVIPAGLEGFFEELSAGLAAGRSERELRAALAAKYDSVPAE